MAIRLTKKGEILTAKRLNELIDLVNRNNLTVSQGGGLALEKTASGSLLRLTGAAGSAQSWAIVTEEIPSCTDPTAPTNTGRIRLESFDPDDGFTLTDGGTYGDGEDDDHEVTVYNRLTLPASIPVDARVLVTEIDGVWWLLQADCPPVEG